MVVAIEIAPGLLFDNFPSPIIEHPLMTCFFEPSAVILVHLLSIDNSIAIPDSTMALSLVNFIYWPAILVKFN